MMKQKQIITIILTLGLSCLASPLLVVACGPINAQLDKRFNADGIFFGIPGTAEIEGEITLANAPSIAGGIALSSDDTIVLGGLTINFITTESLFAAAKTDKSGAIIWQTVVPSPAIVGIPKVAIDSSDCAYLNGTIDQGPVSQFAAVKLSSTGAPVWTAILNNFSTGSEDETRDIAVDASGAVYLAGSVTPIAPFSVFAVAKLSNTGAFIWNNIVPPFSLGSMDQANSIALDQSGCIYLGGITEPAGEDPLFAAAKLSSTGTPLWTATVPRFLSGSIDAASSITIDQSGCIYLGGITEPAGEDPLFAAAKLSNTGTPLWTAIVPRFSPGSTDQANGIALDQSGCIYLGGSTNPPGPNNNRFAAAKLSNTGALLWTSVALSPIQTMGNDITLDSSECIYLGGQAEPLSSEPNFAAIILDQEQGTPIQSAIIPFELSIPIPFSLQAVTTDLNDNIILAGFLFQPIIQTRLTSYKLTSTGTPLWSVTLPSLSPGSVDIAQDVITDFSGSVYLGGFTAHLAGGGCFVAVKLSNAGTPIWTAIVPQFSPSSFDLANGITLDQSGCIYLGGHTQSADENVNFAAAKLSNTGIPIWTAVVPLFSPGSMDQANGIALDQSGCIYLGGNTEPAGEELLFAVAKLSSTGAPIWTATVPRLSSGSIDQARGIALDQSGFIYLGGNTQPVGKNNCFAAVKLSNTGVPIWTAVIPPFTNNSTEDALELGIALDTNGCVYLGGSIAPNNQFGAAKLGVNGELIWQLLVPGNAITVFDDQFNGIAVDSNQAVILASSAPPIQNELFLGSVAKLQQVSPPPLSPLLQNFVPMAAA